MNDTLIQTNHTIASTCNWPRGGNGNRVLISGESRIVFLPEQSSVCQYPPKISAINVNKQSRAGLLCPPCIVHLKNTKNVRYILKTTISKSTKKR